MRLPSYCLCVCVLVLFRQSPPFGCGSFVAHTAHSLLHIACCDIAPGWLNYDVMIYIVVDENENELFR
uniref:Putative secreted peptide n=1 Tax=Anopheles braziliensis TaxID=58242 RepID=A0A2M3ZXT3_9DIPT